MNGTPVFERVRRNLGQVGEVVVAAVPARAVEGRTDEYRLAPSRLIEDSTVTVRPVGPPVPCPEPLAFLDGTQRYEVVGYLDAAPVVAGVVAAAVRLRTAGRFTTVARAERRVLVAGADALDAVAGAAPGFDPIETGESGGHPLEALEAAHRVIDGVRSALEHEVGRRFRADHDDWLVVDGVISDAALWATDPKAIGISKSHATLPFDGEQLTRYLTIPAGHRTSVFEPATWRFTPVHSWGLRLWEFAGRDLLHGLVRIEVAAGAAIPGRADQISRWILAERAPLSRPDPRWDRLLYGLATVERHLRAR